VFEEEEVTPEEPEAVARKGDEVATIELGN